MVGCCGRANNRRRKSNTQSYYDRYAYLDGHQIQAKKLQQSGSTCKVCAAYTVVDPCAICGQVKDPNKEEQV